MSFLPILITTTGVGMAAMNIDVRRREDPLQKFGREKQLALSGLSGAAMAAAISGIIGTISHSVRINRGKSGKTRGTITFENEPDESNSNYKRVKSTMSVFWVMLGIVASIMMIVLASLNFQFNDTGNNPNIYNDDTFYGLPIAIIVVIALGWAFFFSGSYYGRADEQVKAVVMVERS